MGAWSMNNKKSLILFFIFSSLVIALYFSGTPTPNKGKEESASQSRQNPPSPPKNTSADSDVKARTPASVDTSVSTKKFSNLAQIEQEFATKLVVESKNGRPQTIFGKIPFATNPSEPPGARASRFLNETSPYLGTDMSQLSFSEMSKLGLFHVTRFTQTFNGYSVIPSEVAIIEDQNGNIITVKNFFVQIPQDLRLTAKVGESEAVQASLSGKPGMIVIREPQLVIHQFTNGNVELTWMFKIGRKNPAFEEICYVGAQSGQIEKSPTLIN